jgi:hypothetical protein
VKLFARVTTSTSGTVASSAASGLAVTKTATEAGRYTLTLEDKYYELLSASVVVQGAADAAYTATKGLVPFIRGVDVASKVLYVQFADPATSADAELADGASFYVELTLKNSSAR